MAKRNGTHSLLRDKEKLVHELIERKFGDSTAFIATDLQRSATSSTVPNGVIFYSAEYAVLFRDGKLWDVIRHGLFDLDKMAEAAGRAKVRSIPADKFSERQMTPPGGSEGPQGEGWL